MQNKKESAKDIIYGISIFCIALLVMLGTALAVQWLQTIIIGQQGIIFTQYCFIIAIFPSLFLGILVATFLFKKAEWDNRLYGVFVLLFLVYAWAMKSYILITSEKIFYNPPHFIQPQIIAMDSITEAIMYVEIVQDLDYHTYLRPQLKVKTDDAEVIIWDSFGAGTYSKEEVEQILVYFRQQSVPITIKKATPEQLERMELTQLDTYDFFK